MLEVTESPKPNKDPSDPTPWRFKPGQSGNPKGRPRIETVVKGMARAASVEAIETLVTLMRTSKDQKLKRQCAMDLLSYGIGKPRETSEEGTATMGELLADEALAQLLE